MAEVMNEVVFPAKLMICELIQKAMQEIGAIGKDSTATNYNGKVMYKFRGIDAVYNTLNPVMAKYGLFIIPEVLYQTREERQSTNGSTLIYSILKVKFTMYAPDGSSVTGVVIGEGMDSGDKASNKAMSAAMKYFCFQTFMIPTEDMADGDAEVHEVRPKASNAKTEAKVENAPVTVTTSAKLPENPVLRYLSNEQAFMGKRLGIDNLKTLKAWFSDIRNKLIAEGKIKDIPADKLTMEEAKDLIEKINTRCFPSGDAK